MCVHLEWIARRRAAVILKIFGNKTNTVMVEKQIGLQIYGSIGNNDYAF